MTLDDIKSRYEGIQTMLGEIGNGGCLFLALCSIIEEVNGYKCDIMEVVRTSMKNKWLKKDYTVLDSIALLNYYTGKSFKRKEVETLSMPVKSNQYTIEHWFNERTGYSHFKRRFVDTLKSSVTVAEGRILEYYVYTAADVA